MWDNTITEDFEKAWWHEVMTGSYRDQLSFDCALEIYRQ